MRIGGKAPGGGPILSVGILCHVMCRFPPPRIVNRHGKDHSGVVEAITVRTIRLRDQAGMRTGEIS
jgi:hypothetical protein